MSEENKGVVTPPVDEKDAQDPLKNIKAEFSRKQKETNDVLNQIIAQQQSTNAILEKLTKPAPVKQSSVEDDDLSDLMYSDPKAYAKLIKDEAKREALAEMRSETHSKSAVDQTIMALAHEYPELSNAEDALTKRAAEILKNTADHEKTNPRTYEYAVMKAAGELDVKPRSKRATPEEEFVAPSYSSPQGRSRKRSEDQVINQNKDFLKAVGINPDDPKQKEQYKAILKQKGSI